MFRRSSVLVLVLAIRCILSWCSRFGLKMEPVKHVRFPRDFLLRCLLDFELARNYCKLSIQQYWTVQMKGLSHGSPNMKMKKMTCNTVREEIGFWGLCVALSPS